MGETFGSFLKKKRLDMNLGLREFAKLIGMQPSNYCNVEAGSLPPPQEKLETIAEKLKLSKGTDEHRTLFDLAAEARDEVPADVARIVKESTLIPALLRTVENERITDKQLRGIIEDIKSGKYKRP